VNPRSPGVQPFELDRRQMRRAFERASRSYDRAAVLQAEVRARLLARLQYLKLEPAPQIILDAGCGTGHGSRELKKRFPRARVLALDIATGMLREAGRNQGWWRRFDRVCADAERMPLADASVDLIFSNLMLQWCAEPDAVFHEFKRVLKPRGLLTFSTLGPDTLMELRAAWAAVDERTHVSRFLDMHEIGDALVRARLAEPVLDVERFTLTYDTAIALMRDLKAIGAQNATAGRPSGLTGRAAFAAVTQAYERFRIEGRLPATYEVVLGQAWGAIPRQSEVRVPISEIARRGL
jgi:malonyl-CoA O-methyltransferase